MEGDFGVTFNDITRDSVFYTTTSHFVVWFGVCSPERQGLWLPKDDLKDPVTWSSESSPLVFLRDIHRDLLVKYDGKDSVSPPSLPGDRARPDRDSQDGVSHQRETDPLLPRRLTVSMRLTPRERTIPTLSPSGLSTGSQNKSSHGVRRLKTSIRHLRSRVALNSFDFTQQHVVTTVEDSTRRAEMGALESQEEDTPKRVLWYKPLGFLGVIRPHRRDETWSASR